jgi:hypothetical protein
VMNNALILFGVPPSGGPEPRKRGTPNPGMILNQHTNK